MPVVRWAILVLLVAAAVCFGLYAVTSQKRYRHWGIVILKWTLGAAFVFFAVLIVQDQLQ
jgi:hypothetical protein